MKFSYIKEVERLSLDEILEHHLRPLRSFNARRIFVLLNELGEKALTTLDLQRKLEEQGVLLKKKDINLALHSLARAGLVERLPQRGKPTVVEYDGRYRFDLWRVREVGRRIYRGLMNLTQVEPRGLVLDETYLFREIDASSEDQVCETLKHLLRLGRILTLLCCMLQRGRAGMSSYKLAEIMGIPREEVESLLKGISGSTPNSPKLVEVRRERSLRGRVLRVLGLKEGDEIVYRLTERGRRYAEMLC
ncbi:hypothetical protein DRN97_11795 [Methanosarcinales archaeon]|nr:MAG: hypothetical protein DRN97_11795 [Methanosarcinales archaeon]